MPATEHNAELLPNGLHRPTCEFLLVMFESLRERERSTIAEAIFGSREPSEDFLEVVLRLAAMSACADVVETAPGLAPSVVSDGLRKRDAVMRHRKEEREGVSSLLDTFHRHRKDGH